MPSLNLKTHCKGTWTPRVSICESIYGDVAASVQDAVMGSERALRILRSLQLYSMILDTGAKSFGSFSNNFRVIKDRHARHHLNGIMEF